MNGSHIIVFVGFLGACLVFNDAGSNVLGYIFLFGYFAACLVYLAYVYFSGQPESIQLENPDEEEQKDQ